MAKNDEIEISQLRAPMVASISEDDIRSKIYSIRGVQVMLDRDLAKLYRVETKVLNQAVKRNSCRFPEHFMFQLSKSEYEFLRSQFVTIETGLEEGGRGRHSKYLPYVFTEQGVSQLSAVLHSAVAVAMSIRIIDAFVAMRRFISANAGVLQRLDNVERKQIETEHKIEQVLDCLEEGILKEKAHIFSAGQVYEAKSFITELISRATRRVILIDGYVSAPTIDLLDARKDGVSAIIYTNGVGRSLMALKQQYCDEYPNKPLEIVKWRTEQHDRWLIIDEELWHCGASIRDAGIRTFGIDPIGLDVNVILSQL